MQDSCIIVSKRNRRQPKLCFPLLVFIFCVVAAGLFSGCGFHQLWSFSQRPDEWDHRIPGWKVKVDIVHFCREGNEPPLNFIFEIEARPQQKYPDILLGLDSIVVLELDIDNAPDKAKNYVFHDLIRKPHKKIRTHKILEASGKLPNRIICTVFYRLYEVDGQSAKPLAIEYPLFFKKKKRFWLGT